MIRYIKRNVTNLGSFVTLGGAIISVVLWSHNGLSKQIDEVRADTKLAHVRIDSHIQAMNERIDATSLRIDRSYELILEIVRENKREEKK